MGNLTSADLFCMLERLNIPGSSVIYARSISVDPLSQGQGVGSALIKYAVDIADQHEASMWIHMSDQPNSKRAFEKWGFEVVHELAVDLDEYRTKELPEGRDKWGVYTFRLLRRPANSGQSS